MDNRKYLYFLHYQISYFVVDGILADVTTLFIIVAQGSTPYLDVDVVLVDFSCFPEKSSPCSQEAREE